MKVSVFRKKTNVELQNILVDLSQEHFKLRIQKATSQLSRTDLIKKTKRDIARVLTVLSEKSSV